MQKLKERHTNTPTDIPHVRSNCEGVLNIPSGVMESVHLSKTSFNNPDAALTAKGQAEQNPRVSVVYVLNQRKQPLMPCSNRKARVLLNKGKAKVVKCTPFTIQMLQPSGETKQAVSLGVDSGYLNIGLSAVSNGKELFGAEIKLRKDIVDLNSERRQYRRSRRSRKTWYREPRFLNRGNKQKGWFAPSIQNKIDSHLKAVRMVSGILPISNLNLEVAAFDIQKINNPDIEAEGYQQGEQLGFWNEREYVLYRDGHKCQHCKGKTKDPILNVHHLESRKTGGDRPDNLVTLCETCHNKYHIGEIDLKLKLSKGFKAESFMSMVRWKIKNLLIEQGYSVEHTYGHITKNSRIALQLPKTHRNDAYVIAGGNNNRLNTTQYTIKQVRKCNRKLYKGIRSHLKNTAPRYIKGFQRYDKVLWNKQQCFIFGRRSTGYFDLRLLDGTKLHSSAKAKDCRLIQSANTFLIEQQRAIPPLPERSGFLAS